MPPWLALLGLATLMVLLHPFTPRDQRSWTAIVYSVKAVAEPTPSPTPTPNSNPNAYP